MRVRRLAMSQFSSREPLTRADLLGLCARMLNLFVKAGYQTKSGRIGQHVAILV